MYRSVQVECQKAKQILDVNHPEQPLIAINHLYHLSPSRVSKTIPIASWSEKTTKNKDSNTHFCLL